MIRLTRLNGTALWLNPLLVESVEQTPDTVITLANGHKYVVREAAEEIGDRMAAYLRRIGLIAAEGKKEESG
ncbi:MAG: flagellar FlbD family protein [Alicyclobacillus macrosporangiidus]|uniref:Flagellar protein FlbD n=1 Tax=Alicyclobacillus macrosporangiidus TaxID=392015 RepID=A0A1I7IQR7_9BACL|nr:flagellar FlbD family protein [Alicyclobacillus macrosporangiidus]MCL6597360.1 flagellar FlbD family protein [Alicyclobacillus macrosporangiidus]SFU75231.1 flagellar protein FlbD [Alicyclobacillus macrosporangiidus]